MKNKTNEESESFLKTLLIVVSGFIIFCALVFLLEKIGMFEKGYTEVQKEFKEISYDVCIVGTSFNRPDSEYYVIFDDFSNENNIYLPYLISNTTKDYPIYKVDMSLSINSKYKSIESNPNANDPTELKINVPTLIKIKNGRNVKYVEGLDDIEKELK